MIDPLPEINQTELQKIATKMEEVWNRFVQLKESGSLSEAENKRLLAELEEAVKELQRLIQQVRN